MQATLTITLPDGTTRTLELAQVAVQTTYATAFSQVDPPLQSMIQQLHLTATITSGSLAAGVQ